VDLEDYLVHYSTLLLLNITILNSNVRNTKLLTNDFTLPPEPPRKIEWFSTQILGGCTVAENQSIVLLFDLYCNILLVDCDLN